MKVFGNYIEQVKDILNPARGKLCSQLDLEALNCSNQRWLELILGEGKGVGVF